MRYIILAVSLLLITANAHGEDPADTEIHFLLDYVAASGCIFHRNGEDHDAAGAADHLALKYRRGRKYADSAEHFIDRLASSSSWSGEAYSVTCAGQTESTSAWLHHALDEYREARAAR